MKRILKFVTVLVTTIVIIGGVAVTLLPRLINTEELRDEVTASIYDQTGLQVRFEGPIDWSVFPWLGLSVADVHAEGTNSTQLATIGSANLHVKLIPLLSKRIEMKSLKLEGLHLTLVKNKGGVGNWEVSKPTAEQGSAERDTEQTTHTAKGEHSPISFNIANINIHDLVISYVDRKSGKNYVIDNASLNTGAIRNQHPFDFELKAQLNAPKPILRTVVSGEMIIDLANTTYSTKNLNIIATMAVANGETVSIRSDINYQQTPLSIAGNLDIDKFNLARLLKQLGIQLPEMADPAALSQFSFASSFTTDGKSLSADKVQLQLDHFDLHGNLQVTSITESAVTFDFTGGELNADNYLPNSRLQPPSNTSANKRAEPKNSGQSAPAAEHPIIPVAILEKLNIDGTLSLNSLTVAQLVFAKPALKIKASDGLQSVNIGSGFYRGTIDMTSTMDLKKPAKPIITTTAKLANISLASLSESIEELSAFEGTISADTHLKTQGLYVSALTENLNGLVQFTVEKGAFTKANFNRLLCEAVAKVRKKKLHQENFAQNSTPFTNLSGSFNIKNGIAYNNDLIAALDSMNLKGDGNISLTKHTMDYHIGLNIHGEQPDSGDSACQINEKYANVTWPLRCQGDLMAPTCGVDTQRLSNIITDIAKDKFKEKLEEKLQNQGTIRDLLKNLLK